MRVIQVFAVLSLVFGPPALCAADEASMAAVFKQFMATPDRPTILRGDYLKAAIVAYQDFARHLAQLAAETHSNTGNEMTDKLSKLENYDISVDQTPSFYVVQFGPTVRDNIFGVMFGGGVRYEIDRRTFAISNRVSVK
jgi:hypothetical protein